MNAILVGLILIVAAAGLTIVGAFSRFSRRAVSLLVASFIVASVPGLLSDETRTSQTATAAEAERENPVDFFARRVRENPNDVGSRLDLAGELLSAGNFEGAMTEYLTVLQLDRDNPLAHSRIGLLLFRAGLTKPALRAVDRALEIRADHPEALYVKGLITMMGLKNEVEGKRLFRRYLRVAPFGAYVSDIERLLEFSV